ncbi:MAG: hypothetical protein CMC14_10110 [Flavobacteriaceae bacterium]|nr:hypothetical protein [Flavobacteriaceae bacterium]|tara:strand:- start:30870 stop:33068 length:2199 start_codon:yes stop_codon:yes gene_type:complete
MKIFIVSIFILLVATCDSDDAEYVIVNESNTQHLTDSLLGFLKEDTYTNWKLFPDSLMLNSPNQMKRLGLPVHGRYVKTYVNDIAYDFIVKTKKGEVDQPLEFPNGSFIIKQNYRSNIDTTGTVPIKADSTTTTLGVITLLYKPNKKYCATEHQGTYNGEDCLGGDWFYGFYFQDDIAGDFKEPFISVQDSVRAHIGSFCVNCHAPGYNTDYVRTLDNLVNPYSEESFTAYCDRFEETNLINTVPYNAPAPKNQKAFKESLEQYINDATLSYQIPGDVPADPTQVFQYLGPKTTQLMFDAYAWKTFVALNWPNEIGERGKADTQLPFTTNETKATVWETFKPTFEVFQPEIADWNPINQAWNSPMPVPAGVKCAREPHDFVVTMTSKTRDIANETGQAFAGSFGNLIDQEGKQVRYEVLFNRTEFEYLISNDRAATKNLTPSGPKGEANKVNFPDTKDDTQYKEGAMEIKSAWKELCVGPDCKSPDTQTMEAARKKFLVRTAIIYNEETGSCRPAPMALVGLHIARKTYYAPQWIWMTFEHQDNVPLATDKEGTGTFYNPQLEEPDYCYQLPFLYPDPTVAGCPNVDINRFIKELKDHPNQLTRLVPIPEEAQQINTQFQKVLAKQQSPFANYILVNAQWPLNGRQQNTDGEGAVSKLNCKDNDMGTDCFTMKPRFLRNSVIESYMATYCDSEGAPQQFSNRSCMSCHGTAGANLSYIWLDAVSQKVKLQSP